MPTFTYEPKEEVSGWGRQIFGNSEAVETPTGYVESSTVIHGTSEDEIWVCVRRVINTATVYYIELMSPRAFTDIEDAVYVDSAVTYDQGITVNITGITQANPGVVTCDVYPTDADGLELYNTLLVRIAGVSGMTEVNDTVFTISNRHLGNKTFELKNEAGTANIDTTGYTAYTSGGTVEGVATTFTGLTHLAGETVAVYADGLVQTSKIPTGGGSVVIDTAANIAQIGLPYTMKVRSMRLAHPESQGALQTMIKNVKTVAVRYIKSLLGSAGVEYGGTEYLTDIEAAYSTASADTDENKRAVNGGFNEDAYITIVSDDPVPFTVLSTVIEVET